MPRLFHTLAQQQQPMKDYSKKKKKKSQELNAQTTKIRQWNKRKL